MIELMIGTLIGPLDLMEKLKSFKWSIKGYTPLFNGLLSDFSYIIFYTKDIEVYIEGGVKFIVLRNFKQLFPIHYVLINACCE